MKASYIPLVAALMGCADTRPYIPSPPPPPMTFETVTFNGCEEVRGSPTTTLTCYDTGEICKEDTVFTERHHVGPLGFPSSFGGIEHKTTCTPYKIANFTVDFRTKEVYDGEPKPYTPKSKKLTAKKKNPFWD